MDRQTPLIFHGSRFWLAIVFSLGLILTSGCGGVGDVSQNETSGAAGGGPPLGPFPTPTTCLGQQLIATTFDDIAFHQPAYGVGYVTKLDTQGVTGLDVAIYMGRISAAFDSDQFTFLISERPCDRAEAEGINGFHSYNISGTQQFVVSDPSLNLMNRARTTAPSVYRTYVWLKPQRTYFIIALHGTWNGTGLDFSSGYYYFRWGNQHFDANHINARPLSDLRNLLL